MRLTGKDRVFTLLDLGAQDGAPASPGTVPDGAPPANLVDPRLGGVNAIAKTVRYSAKGNTVDVHCPADGSKYLRFTFAEESVDAEFAVGSLGRLGLTLGHYYGSACKALSSLTPTIFSFTGLLVKDEWNSGGENSQTQSITIKGPAEVDPA